MLKSHSTFEFHKKNGHISIDAYRKQKRIETGKYVANYTKVYLDLRFWILLREAKTGNNKDPEILQLLHMLQSLTLQNKIICPVSESSFTELLKQSDPKTRKATAQLIDDLSKGIALVPFDNRISQELCNEIYKRAGLTDLIPTSELVWTKLVNILGEFYPETPSIPPEVQLIIQKSFADHLENISLVEIIERMGFRQPETNWNSIAEKLNSQNKIHFQDLKSYENALRIEFEGALSLFIDQIEGIIQQLHEKRITPDNFLDVTSSPKDRFLKILSCLPSLHITSACHAAVRWDQKRNLVGNDLLDFHHAQAALAYCDFFFTERPLSNLLKQKHLGLSKYPCVIEWNPHAALSSLKSKFG